MSQRYADRLAAQGFVVLRGALRPRAVAALRDGIVRVLATGGDIFELRRAAYAMEEFQAICEDRALHRTVSALLDVPSVFTQPRRFVRIVGPDRSSWSPPHQDHYYVGGSVRTLTAWVPLAPVGPRMGSLLIDSRRPGTLRRHVPTAGFALPRRSVGPFRWRSPHLTPGDVLLLGSLTVHATGPVGPQLYRNGSVSQRLSIDFRVQPTFDPIWEANMMAPFGDEPEWMSRYGITVPSEVAVSSVGAPIAGDAT